ncbi:MAG: hypothetical protein VYC40_00470 [Pseudomonadota bacterium]|nr:hypothetical protein [Pseudomonadota bacterium]
MKDINTQAESAAKEQEKRQNTQDRNAEKAQQEEHESLMKKIREFFENISNGIGGIISKIVTILKQFFTWLSELFKSASESVKQSYVAEGMRQAAQNTKDYMSEQATKIGQGTKKAKDYVSECFSTVGNNVSSQAAEVVGGIKDGIANLFSKAKKDATSELDDANKVFERKSNTSTWNRLSARWRSFMGMKSAPSTSDAKTRAIHASIRDFIKTIDTSERDLTVDSFASILAKKEGSQFSLEDKILVRKYIDFKKARAINEIDKAFIDSFTSGCETAPSLDMLKEAQQTSALERTEEQRELLKKHRLYKADNYKAWIMSSVRSSAVNRKAEVIRAKIASKKDSMFNIGLGGAIRKGFASVSNFFTPENVLPETINGESTANLAKEAVVATSLLGRIVGVVSGSNKQEQADKRESAKSRQP